MLEFLREELREKNGAKNGALMLFIPVGLGIAFLLAGCGNGAKNPASSIINNVALKTYLENSDQQIQADVSMNTGGFTLTAVSLPIMNPMNASEIYGQLTIVPVLCGSSSNCVNQGDLQIVLNITKITQVKGTSAFLPNGTPLPVGGLQNATIISLPIGESPVSAQLYFAFGHGVALLGTALSFSAMDPAGQYVPNTDVFQPVQIGPVNLIAGIYTGSVPATSGIGLFIDLSGVVNQNPSVNVASSLQELTGGSSQRSFSNHLSFNPVQPSQAVQNKLYQKLSIMGQQRLKLSLTPTTQ